MKPAVWIRFWMAGFFVSYDLHRRHDTTNERALVGARMANLRAGGDRGNQHTGGKCPMGHMPNKPAVTIERAAELSGATE